MAKKTTIFFLFLFLAGIISAVSMVSAETTQINIMTLPLRSVGIFILQPGTVYDLYESFHKQSDINGFVQINYTGEPDSIDIKVQVTENNNPLAIERFKNFPAGTPVYLQVIAGDMKRNYNEGQTTQTNNTQTTAENSTNNAITGSAVAGSFFEGSKKLYFIIIGIVLLVAVVGFGAYTNLKKYPKTSSNIVIKPASKIQTPDSESIKILSNKLSETQQRLEQTQRELNRVKNQEKISEVERRIEQERQELERLRKGD